MDTIDRRTYLAGQALTGVLSKLLWTPGPPNVEYDKNLATDVVALADTVIEQLDKTALATYPGAVNLFNKSLDALKEHVSIPCNHTRWSDMESGLGQCKVCLRFLPYDQFTCEPEK